MEASLLQELRKKRTWPCFAKDPTCMIGKRGFRAFGFHERRKCRRMDSLPSLLGKRSASLISDGEQHSVASNYSTKTSFANETSYNIFMRFAQKNASVILSISFLLP